MKILACATLLWLTTACAKSHSSTAVEISDVNGACVMCHQADYDGTNAPAHAGQFPTTCGDCHLTTAWQPALAGAHPEPSFFIATGPHQIPCLTCHMVDRGTSVHGQNTTCTGCHTGEHTQDKMAPAHGGVTGFAWDAANEHFCLVCHPKGQADHHPEAQFPITRGAHAGIACGQCHDKSLGLSMGGMNVSCVGCHTHSRSTVDSQHQGGKGGYAWDASDPKFCLKCHPHGRAG